MLEEGDASVGHGVTPSAGLRRLHLLSELTMIMALSASSPAALQSVAAATSGVSSGGTPSISLLSAARSFGATSVAVQLMMNPPPPPSTPLNNTDGKSSSSKSNNDSSGDRTGSLEGEINRITENYVSSSVNSWANLDFRHCCSCGSDLEEGT